MSRNNSHQSNPLATLDLPRRLSLLNVQSQLIDRNQETNALPNINPGIRSSQHTSKKVEQGALVFNSHLPYADMFSTTPETEEESEDNRMGRSSTVPLLPQMNLLELTANRKKPSTHKQDVFSWMVKKRQSHIIQKQLNNLKSYVDTYQEKMTSAQQNLDRHNKKIEGVKLPRFDLNFHQRKTNVLDQNIKVIHDEFAHDFS